MLIDALGMQAAKASAAMILTAGQTHGRLPQAIISTICALHKLTAVNAISKSH